MEIEVAGKMFYVAGGDPYYDTSDTTNFMEYTCPSVDDATYQGQSDADSAIDDFIDEVKTSIINFIEKNRVVDGVYNYTKAIAEKLTSEIIECILEGDLLDTLRCNVENAFDNTNSEIKHNVTYPWRHASADMMNAGWEDGWSCGVRDVEEALQDLAGEDETKEAVEEVTKELEKYDYWVQFNRDMGLACPEITCKTGDYDDPRTMNFFELVDAELGNYTPSRMWWGPGHVWGIK